MPTRINVKKVAAKNPQVNLEEFRQAQESLRELRETGALRHEYSLVLPFTKSVIRSTRGGKAEQGQ
jgi:hypothetical protein